MVATTAIAVSSMTDLSQIFRQPSSPALRKGYALRAHFVEGCTTAEAARRFQGRARSGDGARDIAQVQRTGVLRDEHAGGIGGGGLGAVEVCLAAHETGRTSDILVGRAFRTVYELLPACAGSRRDEWPLPAVRGDRTCAIAMTEPGAGSDAAGIMTSARRDGRGRVLNGGKQFISDGALADFFAATAGTSLESGAWGISVFLVDNSMPGFTVGRNQTMKGLHGASHVKLGFDDVQLWPEHLVGGEGRGLRLILGTIGRVRLDCSTSARGRWIRRRSCWK